MCRCECAHTHIHAHRHTHIHTLTCAHTHTTRGHSSRSHRSNGSWHSSAEQTHWFLPSHSAKKLVFRNHCRATSQTNAKLESCNRKLMTKCVLRTVIPILQPERLRLRKVSPDHRASEGQGQGSNTYLLSPGPLLSRIIQTPLPTHALSMSILFWHIGSLKLIRQISCECQEQTQLPDSCSENLACGLDKVPVKALALTLISHPIKSSMWALCSPPHSFSVESVCSDWLFSPPLPEFVS